MGAEEEEEERKKRRKGGRKEGVMGHGEGRGEEKVHLLDYISQKLHRAKNIKNYIR